MICEWGVDVSELRWQRKKMATTNNVRMSGFMRKDLRADAETVDAEVKVLARETLYPWLARDVLAADVAEEGRGC